MADGTAPEGRGRPTQRDVALRAGVSVATVSYVLGRRRQGAGPSPATRQRVLAAVDELGYRLDRAGRSLRRGSTELLAVVHPGPSSPWLDELVGQLQRAAQQVGHTVVVLPLPAAPSPVAGDDPVPRLLRERAVDGALVAPDCGWSAGDFADLAAAGLSLVVFDDALAPDGFDVVRQGRLEAWRAAVDHVLDAGHTRVAYLAHAHEPSTGSKLGVLERACVERGVTLPADLVHEVADSRADAHRAVRAMLSSAQPPTAVLAATDRSAVDTIWAASELGLRVPNDLAVVGVGHVAEGQAITPRLTTVGTPELDFSAPVDRLLAQVVDGARPGAELHDPWRLLVRDSA